jgi:hypothetical protein
MTSTATATATNMLIELDDVWDSIVLANFSTAEANAWFAGKEES